MMLELTGITKQFRTAGFSLGSVSFRLGNGLHLLAGPNGAGKSTLLRMIATVLRPDCGQIAWRNKDIYTSGGYKRTLGYLPQTFGLYVEMTGWEFLHYMAGLKGLPPRLARERADFVATRFGIRQECQRRIALWSMGLRQRLGLAQALLNDPAVLILDEPFNGLDPEESQTVSTFLAQLSRERMILISSHVLSGLAVTRLLLLRNGRLCFEGAPTAFVNEARGHVWSLTVSKDQWLKLPHHDSTGAIILEDGQFRCNLVGERPPDIPGVQAGEPGLEEAYIFWLRYNHPMGEEIQDDHSA